MSKIGPLTFRGLNFKKKSIGGLKKKGSKIFV